MARRKANSGGGGGSWLDTYADLVTLLLTFFIMLFSMSSIKEENWEKLLMAFQGEGVESDQIIIPSDKVTGNETGENTGTPPTGTGGQTDAEAIAFDALYEAIKKYVDASEQSENIEVTKGTDGKDSVYIRFSDAIFFNPDNSYLRKESKELLNFLGGALKSVQNELQLVVIAGHTAFVDGDYPVSDWRLSGDRAASVAIYLEDKVGVDKMKLEAIGYGAKYPVATNDTPEGRKKNRRVEMMILGDKAKLEDPEVVQYFLKGTYDEKEYPATGGTQDILVPENAQKDPDAPAESVKPTESTKPKPTESAKPKPTESTKPKPTESTKPKPTESTKPKPTESTKPKPTESTKPKPTESTKPKPTESTKPKPTESAKPKPESTKPDTDEGDMLSPPK